MKKTRIKFPEVVYVTSFLVYLLGSALTYIEFGVELSLWLMTLPILIAAAVTVLPWLGIRWLRLEQKGCQVGRYLAIILQVGSWGTFVRAMMFRLRRYLPPFYIWITLTTLLWAFWLLLFIYSRHACQTQQTDDTLNHKPPLKLPVNEKREER